MSGGHKSRAGVVGARTRRPHAHGHHAASSRCTAPPRLSVAPRLKSLWTCRGDVNIVAADDGSVTLAAPPAAAAVLPTAEDPS